MCSRKITSLLSNTRTNFVVNALWACKLCFIAFRGALEKYNMLSVRNFRWLGNFVFWFWESSDHCCNAEWWNIRTEKTSNQAVFQSCPVQYGAIHDLQDLTVTGHRDRQIVWYLDLSKINRTEMVVMGAEVLRYEFYLKCQWSKKLILLWWAAYHSG